MKRRVVAIVIALVVAVVGAGAVVAYAQSADKRAVAGQEVSTVYIAKKAVPEGTTLAKAVDGAFIVPEQVVAKGVPDGAMTRVEPATRSLVAESDIQIGEVVLTDRFGTAKATKKVTLPLVPKGMVAITVSLSDPQRIAPLLKPGSQIVIYDTFNAHDPKADKLTPNGEHLADKPEYLHATRILLTGVKVIAVGTTREGAPAPAPTATEGKDKSAGTTPDDELQALVTVAVSPKDSLRLVHGIQTGTLYAGLLGKDAKPDTATDVNDNTVLGK
jgi:pilus assembly protein CpaB